MYNQSDNNNCILNKMSKKVYEQPRMFVYEVEMSAILAGSFGEKTGFTVEGDVTSGDDDDVWE